MTEKKTSNATFPKQIGNAWGNSSGKPADSIPQSVDDNINSKKRSNVTFLSGDITDSEVTSNGDAKGNISSKPKFSDIMTEQESEKIADKPPNDISRTRVSFSQEVEGDEERMMRLAIEASLQELQEQQGTSQGFQSLAKKMPPPALKNPCGGGGGTKSPQNMVSFSNNNIAYDENDDMDDDMRMAIALSLQDAEVCGDVSHASAVMSGSYGDSEGAKNDKMDEEEDDRKPSALPTKVEEPMASIEGGLKPSAMDMDSKPESNQSAPAVHHASVAASTVAFAAASASTGASSFTAVAAAAPTSIPPGDESEKLALALHLADLDEYKSSQSANDAAEAASLQLALQLQQEEDARVNLERDAEAARLKREEMCHGGGGGTVGVRTVGRDEFNYLKTDKDHGVEGMVDRRKHEETGMGKLLSSRNYYEEGDFVSDAPGGKYDDEANDYYYYANDRLKGDDAQQDNGLDEDDMDGGIRMNSKPTSTSWKRLDKDTFIGPNNEIKTKHDVELSGRSNAVNLLGSHGAKLKDSYDHTGGEPDNQKLVSVSDRAYNAFRRAESRQSGFKKGLARQGHGRAENMNAAKTRGGAMDGNVRLQISAAINTGLIDNCNGVVKEGKEALVYHADGGWRGRQTSAEESSAAASPEVTGSDGYDVAVKVFKRIAEFKGRGSYVDGDPRYHKQKFKTNDQREQVVLWAEKEYRNLIRAHQAGVAVPKPLYQKENILFMRFLGDNGWPSPQLKEIDMKKGSDRWTTFYCQTLCHIRRLYHCARLIHADLSEYNLLICPCWQASHDHLIASGKRSIDDETLQVVMIDFGQAVDVGHPSAATWLRRDLSTVRDFFVKQGIKTLSNENAEEFVTDPFEQTEHALNVAVDTDEKSDINHERNEEPSHKDTPHGNRWRNTKRGWDDKKDMIVLLKKLKDFM